MREKLAMPNKPGRLVTVAFKVEEELAELLNQLPNKSEFIRKAIAHQQPEPACPLCEGQGIVPRAVYDRLAPVIHHLDVQPCAVCGEQLLLPDDLEAADPDERARLEQFSGGGPLYCKRCYRAAAPCGQCGWHIDKDRLAEHVRLAHERG
jgi:hypothetical protein